MTFHPKAIAGGGTFTADTKTAGYVEQQWCKDLIIMMTVQY